MKRVITIIVSSLIALTVAAQDFDRFFADRTLRGDYIFTGNAARQEVSLRELASWNGWSGRRHNLSTTPLRGGGDLTMTDKVTGEIIYRTSFSSLFQEWLAQDEAKELTKSFEFTLLMPYPKADAEITVRLYDEYARTAAEFKHTVKPSDILIRDLSHHSVTPHRYLLQGGSPKECIDIAIVAEGYTAAEMDVFIKDAQATVDALMGYSPFKENRAKFNIVAVESASYDTNVSIPRKNEWRQTAVNSNFDTFYSERYLTTTSVFRMNDVLANIPYEHIIILANTDTYGGGGIYNSYALTTAHHPMFAPVVVHEFGHSFAGLGDEYYYDHADIATGLYNAQTEPWEPNITTLADFGSKWKDMLPKGTAIPTEATQKASDNYTVGVYEGGGYMTKGVYRPAVVCRMRNNTATQFCPVCQRAIERIIRFYTE